MGGHQADFQPFPGQHHDNFLSATALSKKFRMPGELIAGGIDCCFVNRAGHYSGSCFIEAAGDGVFNKFYHRFAAVGIWLSVVN